MDQRSTPYVLGQLLARLAQVGAVKDAERAYALCSLQPGRVSLYVRRAQQLRKGDALAALMTKLPPDAFVASRSLTVEEQGDFALGYYHERNESPTRTDA